MGNSQLIGPGFLESVRAPNYVNGRLLSAEDLKADKDALLTRLGWVGQAAGYGVVEGLEATQSGATQITVTPGLGLNRLGYAIHLNAQVTLSLSPTATTPTISDDAGRFVTCSQPGGGGPAPEGVYLLTVVPASRLEG